jgi:hypothetical protein
MVQVPNPEVILLSSMGSEYQPRPVIKSELLRMPSNSHGVNLTHLTESRCLLENRNSVSFSRQCNGCCKASKAGSDHDNFETQRGASDSIGPIVTIHSTILDITFGSTRGRNILKKS